MSEDDKITVAEKENVGTTLDRIAAKIHIKYIFMRQKFGSKSPAKTLVIKPHHALLKHSIETALRWAEAQVRVMHDKNLIYDISLP